jgi:hypothetical protein
MQADHDQLAAELAAVTAAYHAVLLSPIDLFPEVFKFLDRGSKVALRGVCRAMCTQVDGSISVVASPAAGFSSPDALSAALVRCPHVHGLTLMLAVDSASGHAPLATVELAGLESLAVCQVGGAHGRMGAWPCSHADPSHAGLALGGEVSILSAYP